MKQFSQQDWDHTSSVFSSSIWLVALQVISQLCIFSARYRRLIFFQRLLDDGHALLVRLSGGVPLERAQLLRSKARDPHVPVPLEDNLDWELLQLFLLIQRISLPFTWTSRTSMLLAFLCLARAQAWLTVCSMKSSAIWKKNIKAMNHKVWDFDRRHLVRFPDPPYFQVSWGTRLGTLVGYDVLGWWDGAELD